MKSIKEILLGTLKIVFIPITMWTPLIRMAAGLQANVLEDIPVNEKTTEQNAYQTQLSDMIEDYEDLSSD